MRIQGILTYADRLSRDCFVQDATGGIRVTLASGQNLPAAGWKVEVTGRVAASGPAPAIADGHLTVLGIEPLPRSQAYSASPAPDISRQYRRVSVRGVARSVASERNGLVTVEIRTPTGTVWGRVPASFVLFGGGWVDAEVAASGVLDMPLNGDRATGDPTLWIPEPAALRVMHPPAAAAALPVIPIHDLLTLDAARLPAHRVRVRGVAYPDARGGEALMDEYGQIPVHFDPPISNTKGAALDVVGFAAWDHGAPILRNAVTIGPAETAGLEQAPAPGSTLTTAAQVRGLAPATATMAYPVRLRAVVTYFDPYNHLLFVQDSTDGIFVELADKEGVAPRPGDLVEITGVSTADFAPNVDRAHLKILSHPGLPQPRPEGFASAIRGREDSHWIELGGTVQRVVRGNGDTLLTLAWGKDRYKAHVLAEPESLASLLDAEVKLRGVCGALFNQKHQMLGIQLFVPAKDCIRVVRQPTGDPFAVLPTPIDNLMRFSSKTDLGRRVRLRATVTYGNLSGSTWVRDATGGIMIQDHEADGLAPGDLVDVVGFPTMGEYSPVLRGSQVKKLSSGDPPAPLSVTAQDAAKGRFDSQLVQVEGTVVDGLQQPSEQVLTIESGGTVFNASLPYGKPLPSMEPGTLVRLTGICDVDTEQWHDVILPRGFMLRLRAPADVLILKRPPWLRADRLAPLLAGAMLLILAALAWAALLRRRVRTQTHALRAQTVQLQAAHQQTREALDKAREAEALDEDSKRIVELIARDEPVDLIVDHIAEAVSLHSEAGVCVMLLAANPGLRVCAVPSLPSAWLDVLGHLEMGSISFSPELRDLRHLSDDPAWASFADSIGSGRFRSFCASPIVVGSATAGAIAAFFRSDHPSGDAQLDLWCNIAALALERRRLHDQLSFRAQHDALTGLPNRTLLYERLEAEIAIARRTGGLLGVLYVDLDGFKEVNDNYGHDAGDAVLQQAAQRMTHSVRRGDTVARIGGDEFVVLLPRLGRREDAEQIAVKIAALLREPVYANHQRVSVSGSVGISIWPSDGDQADPLLRFADSQMYGVKRRRWYDHGSQHGDPKHTLTESTKLN